MVLLFALVTETSAPQSAPHHSTLFPDEILGLPAQTYAPSGASRYARAASPNDACPAGRVPRGSAAVPARALPLPNPAPAHSRPADRPEAPAPAPRPAPPPSSRENACTPGAT